MLGNRRVFECLHYTFLRSEADRFKNEKTIYASEEEERRAKRYDSYMKMAKYMSKEELREAYVEAMIE